MLMIKSIYLGIFQEGSMVNKKRNSIKFDSISSGEYG